MSFYGTDDFVTWSKYDGCSEWFIHSSRSSCQRTIKIQDQDQDKAGQWWWYKGRGWVILLRMHASIDTVFIADTKMTDAQRMISIRRNTKTIWLFCRTTIAKMLLLQISQRIYYFKIEASPEQSQSRQRRRRRHRQWFDLIQSITTRQFNFFILEWIQHILSRKRMRHGWVGLGSLRFGHSKGRTMVQVVQ